MNEKTNWRREINIGIIALVVTIVGIYIDNNWFDDDPPPPPPQPLKFKIDYLYRHK